METCTSLLLKTDPQEQEQEQALKKVEQLLAEGFEVIKMWSNKTLLDKFPCYFTDEIEKELKVDWKNVFFLSLMTTYDTFNLEGKTSIRQWPSLVESEMSIYFKICNYICNKEIVINPSTDYWEWCNTLLGLRSAFSHCFKSFLVSTEAQVVLWCWKWMRLIKNVTIYLWWYLRSRNFPVKSFLYI